MQKQEHKKKTQQTVENYGNYTILFKLSVWMLEVLQFMKANDAPTER